MPALSLPNMQGQMAPMGLPAHPSGLAGWRLGRPAQPCRLAGKRLGPQCSTTQHHVGFTALSQKANTDSGVCEIKVPRARPKRRNNPRHPQSQC